MKCISDTRLLVALHCWRLPARDCRCGVRRPSGASERSTTPQPSSPDAWRISRWWWMPARRMPPDNGLLRKRAPSMPIPARSRTPVPSASGWRRLPADRMCWISPLWPAIPACPIWILELNGARGTAYIDRHLSYHAEGRADSPICAEARVRIPIPASALRQGDNELRITTVDDVADENGDSQISLGCAGAAAHRPARRGSRDLRRAGLPFPQRERRDARIDHRHRHHNRACLSRNSHADARRSAVSRRPGSRTASASNDSSSRFRSSPPGSEVRVTLVLNGQELPARRTDHSQTQAHGLPRAAHAPRYRLHRLPAEDRGIAEPQPGSPAGRNAPRRRLRFSLDGVWLVEQYLRTRSPAAQKEFLEAVRAGRISIPAQYANLMAGGASRRR